MPTAPGGLAKGNPSGLIMATIMVLTSTSGMDAGQIMSWHLVAVLPPFTPGATSS